MTVSKPSAGQQQQQQGHVVEGGTAGLRVHVRKDHGMKVEDDEDVLMLTWLHKRSHAENQPLPSTLPARHSGRDEDTVNEQRAAAINELYEGRHRGEMALDYLARIERILDEAETRARAAS